MSCEFCTAPSRSRCGSTYNDWYCTRAEGHDGPHTACGVSFHNLESWTGDAPHTYRVEVRFDVTGTRDDVMAAAHAAVGFLADAGFESPEVTMILDEDWNPID